MQMHPLVKMRKAVEVVGCKEVWAVTGVSTEP